MQYLLRRLPCKFHLFTLAVYMYIKASKLSVDIMHLLIYLFNFLTDFKNISFEFSTSLSTNLLVQKGKHDNRPRYKYDISWIPVSIRGPKYRIGRTTPQPSPLLLEDQHIESETTQTCSWGSQMQSWLDFHHLFFGRSSRAFVVL